MNSFLLASLALLSTICYASPLALSDSGANDTLALASEHSHPTPLNIKRMNQNPAEPPAPLLNAPTLVGHWILNSRYINHAFDMGHCKDWVKGDITYYLIDNGVDASLKSVFNLPHRNAPKRINICIFDHSQPPKPVSIVDLTIYNPEKSITSYCQALRDSYAKFNTPGVDLDELRPLQGANPPYEGYAIGIAGGWAVIHAVERIKRMTNLNIPQALDELARDICPEFNHQIVYPTVGSPYNDGYVISYGSGHPQGGGFGP